MTAKVMVVIAPALVLQETIVAPPLKSKSLLRGEAQKRQRSVMFIETRERRNKDKGDVCVWRGRYSFQASDN